MFKIQKKDLTKYSTIRTPSFAEHFGIINSTDDIKSALEFARKNNLDFKFLGNGSNILFSKEHYDRILFLKLGESYNEVKFFDDYVEIGGAFSLIQAGRQLINKGYEDFIFFNLIPATIGGAVRQNAGTGNSEEIKDVFLSSLVFDIKTSKVEEIILDNFDFGYRTSLIKKYPDRYIVLSAKFKLSNKSKDVNKLVGYMKQRVKEKIDREPKGFCFGSTFMNLDRPAWEYIDIIYDKLEKRNKINFSAKHKNWIINNGVKGIDVKNLIQDTQEILYRKNDIILKEEVDII